MKPSFTFYIILFVLKLKGLKKDFSSDPIDFEKIRKEDVHDPKGQFFKGENVRKFSLSETTITEVKQSGKSKKLLIFFHGGAFISGPAKHHWDIIKTIHKRSQYDIWMCDYPKAPEHNVLKVNANIDEVYRKALETFEGKDIVLIGDSAGGTLIATLTQRLIQNSIDLPRSIIMVSPVMDASFTNPEIDAIDQIDPILSKKGIISAKRMYAGEKVLKDPVISPLYGDFTGFPETILYMAGRDITYPDQKLAVEKFLNSDVQLEVFDSENMIHVWPFLPVMKEAKMALDTIINKLNSYFD
ncbi:alpha/beta hydrolase fold domain-containing protein [Portibacter lacus]|uniref:Esterase n=1 Tax=Portibacter lacus TaxID=1099794 RepID=A0AA37ST40_9BACT|nr:alpha/beta hydrolase fold domain-containing protein [Portibacter lacus]GLR19958.1 esterase [Portibacter lacus]